MDTSHSILLGATCPSSYRHPLWSRYPKQEELEILVDLYNNQYDFFRKNRDKAYKIISVGEKPRDKNIYSVKTAAMTMVANTLLNHNETYTRR
mgnify:CR=1 FL=1